MAIIVVALIAFAAYVPFSPGFRQERNMRMAEKHLPIVQAAIEKDPRFKYVTLGVYTGNGGSLRVAGDVRSYHERDALERLVASTAPPMPIAISVQVPSEEVWQMLHPEATTQLFKQ